MIRDLDGEMGWFGLYDKCGTLQAGDTFPINGQNWLIVDPYLLLDEDYFEKPPSFTIIN